MVPRMIANITDVYVTCRERNHMEHKMTETMDLQDVQDDFVYHFNVVRKTNGEIALIMTYFMFTSLSTVGFGDYHPVNNYERLMCAIIILFGNAIFGYIIGMFNDMIQEMKQFNMEMEDAENLNSFFTLIQKLNNGKQMKTKLRADIEAFFEYKWNNDKSVALQEESDKAYLEQLPEDVQVAIITSFLYSDFLD